MCTDPEAAKQLAAIKAEIQGLEERVDKLELTINGDGEKEKGLVPRLAAIETKINLVVSLLSLALGAALPVAVKYLFKG